jgi:hypothetical protein
VSCGVLLVDGPTAAEGVDMGYGYRGLGFEIADCSDFALDFVPNIGDTGNQWKPHNPLGAVLEFDEVADIVTPVRMISKYPAGLGGIVLRGLFADIIWVDRVNEGLQPFLTLLVG